MAIIKRFNAAQSSKGMIIPIAAGAMLMIAGITAFVVDLGYQKIVDSELQNLSDAAAFAGASGFKNPSSPQFLKACNSALSALPLNKAAGASLNTASTSNDFTIDMGVAKLVSGSFRFESKIIGLKSCPATLAYTINKLTEFPAVRVNVARNKASSSGEFQSFFSRVFGIEGLGANASSAAMIAVPNSVPSGGTLPLAIGLCSLSNYFDVANGVPKRNVGPDGRSLDVITVNSVQTPGQPDSFGCVHKSQFTTLDPDELSGGTNSGKGPNKIPGSGKTCNASSNGADKVSCILSGDLKAPEVAKLSSISIQNGAEQSLYRDLVAFQGKTVLVPIVSDTSLNSGNNSITPIQEFMPIYIKSVGNKSIDIQIASSIKIEDARPNLGSGSFVTGATTRAFPIAP